MYHIAQKFYDRKLWQMAAQKILAEKLKHWLLYTSKDKICSQINFGRLVVTTDPPRFFTVKVLCHVYGMVSSETTKIYLESAQLLKQAKHTFI